MYLKNLSLTVFLLFIALFKHESFGFQLLVKASTGEDTYLDMNPSDKIFTIKQEIQDREGVPIERQRLAIGGNMLDDTKTMSYYDLDKVNPIYAIVTQST